MPVVRTGRLYAAVAALSIALTVLMTWPLGRISTPVIPASDDANFSIWRLAWIAHQLPRDPAHLFDANIFHPAPGTLAYSDAMLLVGVAGLPFFQLGANPALIHNTLLLAAIVLSMLCAFALARRLTGSGPAALVAAIIFGFAPYRIAHIGHLELQWTMWMPLSMLLLHRLIEKPGAGAGLLLGLSLGAQMLCSIYYGLFLGCYVAIAWLALLPFAASRQRVVLASIMVAAPLVIVGLLYGPPYAGTRAQFGERRADEVQQFSAVPRDYLRVPQENALRGAPEGVAPDERSLFPGAVALMLAAIAFVPPVSRMAVTYLGIGLAAADLSLGVNGWLFPLLQSVFSFAGSLRSPARFGVLVLLSVSVLAAIGAAKLFQQRPAITPALAAGAVLLCLTEYWSGPLPHRPFNAEPSPAHVWLAQNQPGSIVLEMPTPTTTTLWRHETIFQVRSINHWQPLINGYSGFPPFHYERMINEMEAFPQKRAVDRLRRANVKFILLNREFYTEAQFADLLKAVEESKEFWPPRAFGEGGQQVVVLEPKY
jgi:hypothetical protein